MNCVRSGNLKPWKVAAGLERGTRGGGGRRSTTSLELVLCSTSPHWALQTSSRRMTSRGHSRASCAQSVILREAHCGCKRNFITINWWKNSVCKLTPSFVQMQLVQGLGKADSPTLVCLPPIVQPVTTFSRHALKSICGIEWQGTRGFLKLNTMKLNF